MINNWKTCSSLHSVPLFLQRKANNIYFFACVTKQKMMWYKVEKKLPRKNSGTWIWNKTLMKLWIANKINGHIFLTSVWAITVQLTFICSKSTIETPEKVKLTIRTQDVVLVFLLLTLNIFHTFFWCFYC